MQKKENKTEKQALIYHFSIFFGAFLQGLIGGKSKVQGRKPKVESLRSKVESQRSKVENQRSKAFDLSPLTLKP